MKIIGDAFLNTVHLFIIKPFHILIKFTFKLDLQFFLDLKSYVK